MNFLDEPGEQGPSCHVCGLIMVKRGIYIASKTKHAPHWLALRESGVPIISTWIDEYEAGASSDLRDLWIRIIRECVTAGRLIVYSETGDALKGALIEVGAALAGSVEVVMVGSVSEMKTARNHPLVKSAATIGEAIKTFKLSWHCTSCGASTGVRYRD